jgi:hypothetical protein
MHVPRAFIIRPFGKKKDHAGREIDFDHVQTVLIEPALKEVGLGGGTTGEIVQAANTRERNRKQEYPTTHADGRMPNRSRDNRRSSREDRARRSALHIGPHEGFD